MAEKSAVRDIAREAEEVIVRLAKEGNGQNDGATELTPTLASEVKYLKVKLAYQAGRNPRTVRPFLEAARLREWIDGIGTEIRAYEEFAHYVEALVAYHKYHGGRD